MLTRSDDMTYEHPQELYVNRNKSVAKSFYRQLKSEGFTHQQIIELNLLTELKSFYSFT